MEKYMGYVGAPYNFIEMNEKVYEKKELQPHDVIESRKHSGMIEYEVQAKTPILIDNGKGGFYQNAYGEAAIPGSTMRGLVRNNMQILSFSSFADDIQNAKLMYRNVASGKDKEKYNTILGNDPVPVVSANGKRAQMSVLMNVQAGYLRNENGRYCIVPTVLDAVSKDVGAMNYYVLNERKIIEGKDRHFDFLLNHKPYILQNKNALFQRETRGGRVHYKGRMNEQYHPYAIEISYEVSGVRQISGVAEWGELSHNGYLVSTGKMQEKKAVYIIPEIDENKEKIQISAQDIDDFKRDYEGRKNQVEAAEEKGKEGFFALPKNGETKPVFYIRAQGKLYFGFTPRLRLFYEKEIYDGVYDSQLRAKRDYSKMLFGYTSKEESYKSRLSFADAVIVNGEKCRQETTLILGSPKPTSYLDYLTSKKDEAVSYNDDFTIRGVKQYWLKQTTDPAGTVKSKNVASVLHPYQAGAVFRGVVRFENLSDEELGMLLWSLQLEKESNQNIGKAKPYGYGRIAVRLTGLKLLDYQAMYQSDSLCLNPYRDSVSRADDYVKAAKDDMTAFLGHDVMSDPRIKHFLMMKDTTRIPDSQRTKYMSIDAKEYQNRLRDLVKLPTVEDVIEGKPVMYTRRQNSKNGSGGNKRNYPQNGRPNGGKNRNSYNRNDRGKGTK